MQGAPWLRVSLARCATVSGIALARAAGCAALAGVPAAGDGGESTSMPCACGRVHKVFVESDFESKERCHTPRGNMHGVTLRFHGQHGHAP